MSEETLAAMSSAETEVSIARPANVKQDLKNSQQAEASSSKETSPDKVDNGVIECEAGSLVPAASAEASAGVLLFKRYTQPSSRAPKSLYNQLTI